MYAEFQKSNRVNIGVVSFSELTKRILTNAIEKGHKPRGKSDRKRDRKNRWR